MFGSYLCLKPESTDKQLNDKPSSDMSPKSRSSLLKQLNTGSAVPPDPAFTDEQLNAISGSAVLLKPDLSDKQLKFAPGSDMSPSRSSLSSGVTPCRASYVA